MKFNLFIFFTHFIPHKFFFLFVILIKISYLQSISLCIVIFPVLFSFSYMYFILFLNVFFISKFISTYFFVNSTMFKKKFFIILDMSYYQLQLIIFFNLLRFHTLLLFFLFMSLIVFI